MPVSLSFLLVGEMPSSSCRLFVIPSPKESSIMTDNDKYSRQVLANSNWGRGQNMRLEIWVLIVSVTQLIGNFKAEGATEDQFFSEKYELDNLL